MKHANLAIMFQEGIRPNRYGSSSGTYADFHGDRPRPSWLSTMGKIVRHWLDRHHQRAALGRLDERLLKDIGRSRIDVAQEMEKPFWRP